MFLKRPNTRRGSRTDDDSINQDSIDRVYLDILHNTINDDYLQSLYPSQNLNQLTSIRLQVDTSNQSLLEIHNHLPCLNEIILDNSHISSIRDLGIGLRKIRILSLTNCRLHDLDGIGVLTDIEILNVNGNYLTELYPLAMHENIKNLYVENNNIADLSVADTLSTCPSLSSLSLVGNPIKKLQNYSLIVASLIPSLNYLDNKPVDREAASKVSSIMMLEAASQIAFLSNDFKPQNPLYIDSPFDNGVCPDTGSELTHGSSVILAGSAASAIRQRRNNSKSDQTNRKLSTVEIFDDLFKTNQKPTEYNTVSMPYFKEGDITELFMSDANPENSAIMQRRMSLTMKMSESLDIGMDEPSISESPSKFSRNHLHESPSYRPITAESLPSQLITSINSSLTSSRDYGFIELDENDQIRSKLSGKNGFRSGVFDTNENRECVSTDRPPSSRPTSSYIRPRTSSSKSLVHLDVVHRHNDSMKSDRRCDRLIVTYDDDDSDSDGQDSTSINRHAIKSSNEWSGNHNDNSDSDDEHMISHAARHRLMSSRNSRSSRPGTSSSSTSANFPPANKANSTQTSSQSSSSQSSKVSNLGIAGMSKRNRTIGQDEDDESDSNPSTARPNTSGSGRRSDSRESKSTLAGKSLGFDLHGSLAAIEKWAEELDSSSDEEHPTRSHSDDVSSRNSASNDIILPNHTDDTRDSPFTHDTRRIVRNKGPVKRSLKASVILAPIHPDDVGRRSSASTSSTATNPSIPVSLASSSHGSTILHRDTIISMFSNESTASNTRQTAVERGGSSQSIRSPAVPQLDSPKDIEIPITKLNNDIVTKVLFENTKESRISSRRNQIDDYDNTNIVGEGVTLPDAELIAMLQKPPKTIPQLRTKTNFQAFFSGIDRNRMERLLESAYADIPNEIQRREKVIKRLELLS